MIDNRRDYYRIKAKAHVQYHLLHSATTRVTEKELHHPAYLEMMDDLHTLDLECNRLLAHIADSERTSAALFKAINKKIEILARTVAMAESNIPEDEIQTIDISEGGMAFHAVEHLGQGQKLFVRIVLIPAFFSVTTEAQVVQCETQKDITAPETMPHWTRVNFNNIEEQQQQLLARYILKLQQQKRRQQ